MQHLIHVLFKSVSYTDSGSLCWWVVWFTVFWKMCHGVCHSGALVVGWLLIHKCHDTVIVLNVCCIICQPGTLCCGKVTDSQMLMCFENVFTVVYTVQVLCLVCAVFLIVVTMPSFRCCRLWWDIWFTSVCSFIQVLSVVVRCLIHQPVLFHSGAVGCGETSDSPACAVQPGSHQSLQVPHPQGQGSLQTEPSRVFTCESVTCAVPFLFLSYYDCSVWHPLALLGPVLCSNRLGVASDSIFLSDSLPFGCCVLGIFCHGEHC